MLILDGDLGMANCDIMFSVRPQYTIYDIISGDVDINEVLIEVSKDVFLIPGGSGIFRSPEYERF